MRLNLTYGKELVRAVRVCVTLELLGQPEGATSLPVTHPDLPVYPPEDPQLFWEMEAGFCSQKHSVSGLCVTAA